MLNGCKKYISVHTLNKYIKARFDQDASLHNVYITGEISNYRPHPSGHLYFTLKDDHSRISAVMFSSAAKTSISIGKWNESVYTSPCFGL